MKSFKPALLAAAVALLALPVMAVPAHPKIGFSFDDLRLERWSRDRDYFVAAAQKLDAKVFVQSADANEQKQIAQIENLISRGVDVIVIVPFNATVLTNAVAEAKKAADKAEKKAEKTEKKAEKIEKKADKIADKTEKAADKAAK